MAPLAYVVVDVFTSVPLEGNPLSVFSDGRGLSDELMQRLARETNHSETVFVLPGVDGADARIRIFTPAAELSFAGHPVLGAAFVVAEQRQRDTVRLATGAGVVTVALQREHGRLAYGEMEQPIPRVEPFEERPAMLEALGVGSSTLPVELYVNGPRHVFVGLGHLRDLAGLQPDLGALTRLGPLGINCFAGLGTELRTRNFSPALGVPEDPATGSAAGPLAVHLLRHGRLTYGEQLTIRQGVECGRPSLLRARVDGADGRIERVAVGGAAVFVARGEYRLP